MSLALGNNPFQIVFANEAEEALALRFDVVAIEQPFGSVGHHGS